MLTLTDVAKMQSKEVADLFITAQGNAAELDVLPVETIPGRSEIVPSITAGASASFRDQNEGVVNSDCTLDNFTLTTGTLLTDMILDSMVLANAGANKANLLAKSAVAAVKKFKLTMGSELIYSAAGSKGFRGLVDFVADDMVVNANGDTSAGCTSAWLVYVGVNGACLVLGNDGKFNNPEWKEEMVTVDNKRFPAMTSYIQAFPAFKLSEPKGLVRIANLDVDHKLTDVLIAEALSLMPAELRANKNDVVILTNSRGVFQLRSSRTATNQTGAPVPIPTEAFGYRIIETSSIVDTEAVWTAPESSSSGASSSSDESSSSVDESSSSS